MTNSFFWRGGTGDFGVASNWNTNPPDTVDPSGFGIANRPPGPGDLVEIAAGGVIFGSGAATQLGIAADLSITGPLDTTISDFTIIGDATGSGAVTLSSLWHDTGSLAIGYGANGSLTITSGGELENDGAVFLGETAGTTASVTIQAAATLISGSTVVAIGNVANAIASVVIGGAQADWSTSGELLVGSQGSGSVSISGGGTLSSGGPFDVVAAQSGSSGSVLVDGAGSLWDSAGVVGIGVGSDGTLVVSNGGSLFAAQGLAVGQNAGSVGSVLIESGGTATTDGTAPGAIASQAGSQGTITIDGAGSVWDDAAPLIIGYGGTGDLVVNGGTLIASAAGAIAATGLEVGGAAGGSGSLSVSNGGIVRSDGTQDVIAGGAGSGTVVVDGVGSAWDSAGGIEVGTDGSATLTVSDNASLSALGEIIVGGNNASSGRLTIETGATVGSGGSDAVVGANQGSTGVVLVDGTPSAGSSAGWNVHSSLVIGNQGSGAVTVQNDGSIAIDDGLMIGSQSAAGGTLLIRSGGTVTVAGGDSNTFDSIGGSGSGTLTVTDAGSLLSIDGGLEIGSGGNGLVSILNGGSVYASGVWLVNDTTRTADTTIGGDAGSNGTMVVAGGGVFTTGGNLVIGAGGVGTLAIDPDGIVAAATLDLGAAGTIALTGGTLAASEIVVSSGAIIAGYGTIDAATIGNAGLVTVAGGDLTLQGVVTGSGTIDLTQGATLSIAGSEQSAIAFTGSSAVLVASDPSAILGTLSNFMAGDAIDLTGISANQAVFDPTADLIRLSEVPAGGGIGTAIGTIAVSGSDLPMTLSATPDGQGGTMITDDGSALCFCAGTLILTPTGEVAVETLAEGDVVLTHAGLTRTIRWLGSGKVLATRGQRSAATPVIVRKSAFADNVPHRDLKVTKGHAFLCDGVLIPVEFLINHRTILWDDRAQEVTLFHVELDSHDVLLANGAAAESYRDDGNRWLFQNANSGWSLPPKPPCASVLTGGPVVDAVWRRLLDRSGFRTSLPLTDDPDLHLVVDGTRLDPIERSGDRYAFRLAVRPKQVRLASRSSVPQELGLARDDRALGVAVREIMLTRRTHHVSLAADDADLVDGFHAYEATDRLRWTSGDARVPQNLFAQMNGPAMLVVCLAGCMRYVDDGAVAA